ncbi:MAG: hypothetical protein ACFBZ8_09565 [Opitutales bacterium]
MKIKIIEAERGLLERELQAKAELKRMVRRILPIAILVTFLAALTGYLMKLLDLSAFITISCVPLLPVLLLFIATKTEGQKLSWTLTDHVIKMSGGFFMPLPSIVSWKVDVADKTIQEIRITVRNKGQITRSIQVSNDHSSQEFIKELECKCGSPSPKM